MNVSTTPPPRDAGHGAMMRYGIIYVAIMTILTPGLASAQQNHDTTELDRIAVTGSRIKRAEVEGALPVVVIDRAQIAASGEVTVADFLRNTSFNSFGSPISTSGNTGLGRSAISLRGMGSARTLILIDGRRAPVTPQTGSGNDLNTIPLAAVERFEILSDGASAVYGSDAIGGVINVITRRDFEGTEINYGRGYPNGNGGDTEEGSILFGASGENGRLLGGASYENRDVIYTRDRDFWMSTRGTSTYSNNLYNATVNPENTFYGYSPGTALRHPVYGATVPNACGDDLFWISGTGEAQSCQFDHKQQSAQMSKVATTGVFLRGDHAINNNWMSYFNASVSRVEAYGQFASVPSSPWPGESIFIPVGSPNHPGNPDGYNAGNTDGYNADVPYFLRHRFAASGTRNTSTETTTSDFMAGVQGQAGMFDIDAGVRYNKSRYVSFGQNYIVGGLAQQVISDGRYNIYDPYNNPAEIVNSFTSTISRQAVTTNREVFASASFDLFQLPGGAASAVVGAEYREETFADIFDGLSEAGQIVGSSGNSAQGARDAKAAYFETLFPLFNGFELNIAGRYDRYSDYGSDFSPKVSVRWHPLERWTFRASWGEGFRAPPLDILSQKPSFSAATVRHRPTCDLQGLPPDRACSTQITTYGIANPNMESENSEQYGLGVVWDATDWLNIGLDYYHIKVNNRIVGIGAATIIDCMSGAGTLCPPGLSFFPTGTVIPNPSLGLGITIDPETGGVINAQTGSTNLGMVITEGYDLSARTSFDVGYGRLGNRLQLGYVSKYRTDNGESVAGRPGNPRIRANLSNSWSNGSVSVNWNINYIHHTQSQVWRNIVADDRSTARMTAARQRERERLESLRKQRSSWPIQNIQVSWEAPWNARLSVGVNNLTNKEAVLEPLNGDEFDSSLYNTWGRTPYFRYSQKF